MATVKMSASTLLDHGLTAAPAAALRTHDDEASIRVPVEAPGEVDARLMTAVKSVSAADRFSKVLVKAVLAARNPLELATAMINARHQALGGTAGLLGAPTTAVQVCPDRIGYYRHFKGGSIYWSPNSGAHEVHGAIRAKWAALGWERSALGYPRTDELTGDDPKREGRYNHFQHGSIYWHPQTGAYEVHGAILVKYRELGAEASLLGYPTTDETATPDGVGRFNHFQRGSIYWTPSTWAHEVHGLIRNYWAQHGWERNPQLGYPITDELIPHRGIGYGTIPTLRQPLLDLPVDVLRLPDPTPASPAVPVVQPLAGARTLTATTTATRATVTRATAPKLKLSPVGTLTATPVLAVDPSRFVIDHKGLSRDRFSDFENGVVFWRRGTNAATLLAPRPRSPRGTKAAWTAAEATALIGARVRQVLGAFPGATVGAAQFLGTTGYSFDGAGVHNRAHRVRVTLSGKRASAPTQAASTQIEVRAEISLDPVDREVVGYLTAWQVLSTAGDFHGGGSLIRALHARLDPALWKEFLVTKVPAGSDDPIAILSVKTHSDGRVAVYFEP